MAMVHSGRYTAHIEGPFVIFIIGVRINKIAAIHKWLPVTMAMSPMLQELYKDPSLGFMHATYHLNFRGISLVQYWRSFEQLEHYARHGAKHMKAWREFNQKVGSNPAVGIYHETYLVRSGGYEAMYNNMPVHGLAKAGTHIPITPQMNSARQRLHENSRY